MNTEELIDKNYATETRLARRKGLHNTDKYLEDLFYYEI